jgi:hypothetical protein
MKEYLSKRTRTTAEIRFNLTHRDIEIIQWVNRCRYLRSSQVKMLLFPECKSLDTTHRRLKLLFHNGYLGRITPYMKVGDGTSEIAYYVDTKGFEVLQAEGQEVLFRANPKKIQVGYKFLEHTLALAQFRVLLELALKNHPTVTLHRFTHDFELKGQIQKAIGRKQYKLYDEVLHPVTKESFVVYPDGLFILKAQTSNEKGELEEVQRLFLVEVDMNTEAHTVIKDKITGFSLYKEQNIFRKWGKFDSFFVLFVTTTPERAKNIRHHLTGVDGTKLVWVSDAETIKRQHVLDPVWINYKLEMRVIAEKKE